MARRMRRGGAGCPERPFTNGLRREGHADGPFGSRRDGSVSAQRPDAIGERPNGCSPDAFACAFDRAGCRVRPFGFALGTAACANGAHGSDQRPITCGQRPDGSAQRPIACKHEPIAFR